MALNPGQILTGLFDKEACVYKRARPTYPAELYSMLAKHAPSHSLAWDIATGNGQAAIGVAKHFHKVIASDISETKLAVAKSHPNVQYIHTPLSLTDDELVKMVGGESSVDLVTIAAAIHWIDLDQLYRVVNCVLKKPDGLFAVWGYNQSVITPQVDEIIQRFLQQTTTPYWPECIAKYVCSSYDTLPFPFTDVGLGSQGKSYRFDMPFEMSLDGLVDIFKTLSAIRIAKEQGVNLLSERFIKEIEDAWGERENKRKAVFKVFILVGKPIGRK